MTDYADLLRLKTPATVEAVLREAPDVVVVATGGHAAPPAFTGAEHAVTSWQILSGRVAAGSNVMVYDECGQHQGIGCADYLSHKGAAVELVTLDRMAGEEVGGPSQSTYLRRLYRQNVVMSPNLRLRSVYPEGNALIATLKNEHSDEEEERKVDQLVCELGTLPNDELYFGLKPHARNRGEIDLDALAEDKLRPIETNPAGSFQLFRVGDAVLSRNVHAAIYESARILKNV
jgi:pyruvate/2-oxoglutarate dehydrogenase complex dihydrolipoamide dehydrogenase (E3) component